MLLQCQREGSVAKLLLNRPDRAHAYNRQMLQEMEQILVEWMRDPPVVLVIGSTGEGSFCGGADLKEMKDAPPLSALELQSQRVFTMLARMPSVSIAAIQGPAVAGGMELALACDLRVAGPRAVFWLPETALGIIPSAGGTTRLSRLVGVSRAKAVILGGMRVEAEKALEWGLVQKVAVAPMTEAMLWAEEICKRDVVAMRLAKQLMDADEREAGLLGERVAEAILYSRKKRS